MLTSTSEALVFVFLTLKIYETNTLYPRFSSASSPRSEMSISRNAGYFLRKLFPLELWFTIPRRVWMRKYGDFFVTSYFHQNIHLA